MSDPSPEPQQRASRTVKLVLMGVAGAALLDSCAPAVGSAVGLWPGIWFLGNPFYCVARDDDGETSLRTLDASHDVCTSATAT